MLYLVRHPWELSHVDAHRLYVPRRVVQRLTFEGRARRTRKVQHIGGQSGPGQLKRHSRPSRGFEEEIDDDLAAQRRDFLHAALRNLAKALGGVENEADFIGTQVLKSL